MSNHRLEILNKGARKVEILFDGVIGSSMFDDGITRKALKNEIERAGEVEEIHLHINSPGGLVDEGMAIYNYLAKHDARIIMHIDGLAASAATFVAMAGDEIRMAANATFMVHNSRVMAIGDKNLMDKVKGLLEKTDGLINLTYHMRTGLPQAEISDLMDDETQMTAEEAKDRGFIDTITPLKQKDVKNVSDYKDELEEVYGRWVEAVAGNDLNDFDKTYRIAASLIPEKPFSGEKFTTKPFDVNGDIQGTDGTININGLRYGISKAEVSGTDTTKLKNILERWQKRDSENTRWLRSHKIELTNGNNVFLYGKLEVDMLNTILNQLEVDTADEAVSKIKELQAVKPAVVVDDTETKKLRQSVELLTNTVADLQADREKEKTRKRDERIEALISDGYVKPAQREHYQALYDVSREAFEMNVTELEKDAPRWKSLEAIEGTTATVEPKPVENKSAEEQIIDKANQLKTDNPKISFSEAYNQITNEHPELVQLANEQAFITDNEGE